MFSGIWTVFRWALFAVVVLVVGNWIKWHGLTISDQVKVGMAQAEKLDWAKDAGKLATSITRDVKKGMSNSRQADELTPDERRKLRELIHGR